MNKTEEKKYYMFIISAENVSVIKEKKIIGFKKKFLKLLKKLSLNDEAIIYIKGKKIMGLFQINSKLFEESDDIFEGDLYPLRLKLKNKGRIIKKEFINSLIPRLEFIKNKKYWAGSFQGKSIINLSKKDFKLLKDYLNRKELPLSP